MNLDNKQKKFIINHIQTYSLAELAQRLNLEESTILDYLKKRWREDKFEKYLASQKNLVDNNITNFQFQQFFAANKGYFFVLLLLVGICYINSLGNGFVSDDIGAIRDNPNLGNFSNVTAHFIGSLQSFFYYLIFHIDGANPSYFRLVNILFHLGNTFLIFIILNILHNKKVAFIAASLFAVHPMLVESVSWISAFTYTQYSFYFLLSLIFYILFSNLNQNKYYVYSLIAFAFSLYASEKAISLPAMFVVYELAYGNLKKNWKKLLPYVLLMLPFLLYFSGKIDQRISGLETELYKTSHRPAIYIVIPLAIFTYLKLTLWPQALSLYHTELSFGLIQYFLCLLLFGLLLASLWWGFRKNKLVFFWLSLFFIALSPTMVPNVAWVVAERYAYLATLGITVIIASGMAKLLELEKEKKYNMVTTLLILILAVLSIRTILRNRDWKNHETLWLATEEVSPNGYIIHNNLGLVYAEKKEYAKAIEEYKKAVDLNPNYADAYHNLAKTYVLAGNMNAAVPYYQKTLEINPQMWQTYYNLGMIYYEKGEKDKGLELLAKSAELSKLPERTYIMEKINELQK